MSSYRRRRLYEADLNRLLTLLPHFTARDQYIRQIAKSARTRLQVDKPWMEQSHKRLSKELKKLFPAAFEVPSIERASLKLARAYFSCHRHAYLPRVRRRKLRELVNRLTNGSGVDGVAVVEPGPRLPAVTRQRRSRRNAGSSIITAPPRAVELSIGASFIASTYMERVIKYSQELSFPQHPPEINSSQIPDLAQNLNQTHTPSPSLAATPPNSLFTAPQNTTTSSTQDHFHNGTQVSDVTTPKLPEVDVNSETHSNICSNASGIAEVKLFLENCSPSMLHHLDSFINAGVKNGDYLEAVCRLCMSDHKALSRVLESGNLSTIDSILLREYLLQWVDERRVNNDMTREYTV